MIRSIVVPLDGSRFAEAAIATARQLALSARAELHLVQIHEPAVVQGVFDDIRETGAELVVMATHGQGSVAPPAMAALADSLIRTSPTPVLLVQPQGDPLYAPVGIRALLAPVSLERDPESVIAALADFACLTQAHVTLLNVVALTAMRGAAQQRLDSLADQLRARGIPAAARVVVGPDIPVAIIKELGRGPANILAVAPRRLGESGQSPKDGITESLLRGATKPLLIVPSVATAPQFAPG